MINLLLPWLLVAVAVWLVSWLGLNIVRQLGKVLLRLEAIEKRLGEPPAAPGLQRQSKLPVGTPAPDFELPDLSGQRHALADFRGRRLLLIFFNPQCGFCAKMAPDIAALSADGSNGRPIPVVVSTGDAEQNRRLVKAHDIRCHVLLQERMEIASKYDLGGTPMGYLIDEQGNIASGAAVGASALLALAAAPVVHAAEAHHNGNGATKGKANKGLAASRINRSGLKAGTSAPGFRLPQLNGGALSLEDYRGRRVLLVFSDPQCGPCQQLAPELELLHQRRSDLSVVMVSRGDEAVNRKKVTALRLTFPVALQTSWEVSRLYGIFATPVGYLIDEQGVIAADPATGVAPILALVGATVPTSNKRTSPGARKAVACH